MLKENIKNQKTDSAFPLIERIKELMAIHHSDHWSMQTQKGLLIKVESGYFVGSLPYGYKRLNSKEIVIDLSKALLVKQVFSFYASGICVLKELKRILEELGFVYSEKSPEITVARLRKILKNISYTGMIHYKGKNYAGKQPEIISSELFEEVQNLLNEEEEYYA